MKMSEEIKNAGVMIASAKMVEVLMTIFEDSEKASQEVKNFVRPYIEDIEKTRQGLEAIFGKDFLD